MKKPTRFSLRRLVEWGGGGGGGGEDGKLTTGQNNWVAFLHAL